MADEPEPFTAPSHIPSFAKPLTPYIKSRQEALHIRQALTAYLSSHITFAEDDSDRPYPHAESHLSLCAPHHVVSDVKRTQSDVSGLRREYLEALRANVAARKEYQSASEDVTTKANSKRKTKTDTVASPSDPASGIQGYLLLLRDRRRHAKLQVFQRYLQELQTKQGADPDHFDKTEQQSQHLQGIVDIQDGVQSSSGSGVEGLVHKLERAVIRARAQLNREKQLFEELKSKYDANDQPPNDEVKIQALKRIRDSLVLWVEEKLMSVGAHDEAPVEDLSPEEIEHAANLLEERKSQIAQQYTTYTESRRALLDSAAKACQPVAIGPIKPQQSLSDSEKFASGNPSTLESMDVLSFASELLLPLSKSQRALALQKSYLAGMLSKEKSTTLRILNRLRDESHLLPEYPIPARQPRFKHRNSIGPRDQAPPDELITLSEAWAFASGAARDQEQEYVAQKVVEGGESLHEALQILEKVCDTLNQNLQEVFPDGQEIPNSDLDKQPPRKLWSGPNGQVGLSE